MNKPTLIINADDLGYDPAVTDGIIESIRNGIVSSTSLLVNTSYSERSAAQADGIAVGLHLNLARYLPVSPKFPVSFVVGGQFSEAMAPKLPPEVVERETLAQLDRANQLLHREPTHIDVHKHLHRHAGVLAGVIAAARARGLPVRSLNAAMRLELNRHQVATTDHFIGDAGAQPYWTLDRLEMELSALPPGVTELMCHPGYAPQLVHSGYSSQREIELRTFTSSSARALVDRNGVNLVTFQSLRERSPAQ
jgi:chitin disaccharide deacetylase